MLFGDPPPPPPRPPLKGKPSTMPQKHGLCVCVCVSQGVDESGREELRDTESLPVQAHKQLDRKRKSRWMIKTEEQTGGGGGGGGQTEKRDGQVGRKSIDLNRGSDQTWFRLRTWRRNKLRGNKYSQQNRKIRLQEIISYSGLIFHYLVCLCLWLCMFVHVCVCVSSLSTYDRVHTHFERWISRIFPRLETKFPW